MHRLMCCPPDMVGKLWPHVRHYIERATARAGDLETEDIERMLSGGALLWVITDATGFKGALVTRLYEARQKKFCEVIAIGGDGLDEWRHLIAELETFARNEGCQNLRMSGRKGWSRVFPDYSTTCVMLEKRL
jgi:hypothetical protein